MRRVDLKVVNTEGLWRVVYYYVVVVVCLGTIDSLEVDRLQARSRSPGTDGGPVSRALAPWRSLYNGQNTCYPKSKQINAYFLCYIDLFVQIGQNCFSECIFLFFSKADFISKKQHRQKFKIKKANNNNNNKKTF